MVCRENLRRGFICLFETARADIFYGMEVRDSIGTTRMQMEIVRHRGRWFFLLGGQSGDDNCLPTHLEHRIRVRLVELELTERTVRRLTH